MVQFVRINQTFINLDAIRMVVKDPAEIQVTVFWISGNYDVYQGESAANIIQALEYLKMLSIAVPGNP